MKGAADEEHETGQSHPFEVFGGEDFTGGFEGIPGKGEDDEGGEGIAQSVEEVDTADLSGDALGHEGGTPDDGDEEEGEICFEAHGGDCSRGVDG